MDESNNGYAYILDLRDKDRDEFDHFMQNKNDHSFEPLKIDNKGIDFFIDSLSDYCNFYRQVNTRFPTWMLVFFKGSPFPVHLRIRFWDKQQSENREEFEDYLFRERLATVIWKEHGGNDGRQDVISNFFEKIGPLKHQAPCQTGHNNFIACGGDTLGFCSTPRGDAQFERIVLCQALAAAYMKVCTAHVRQLTELLKHPGKEKEVIRLFNHIHRFLASDYFTLPIKFSRHELFAVWQSIRNHWQLDSVYTEVTSQLDSVAPIIKEQEGKWLRGLITGFGLFFGALALVTVTPDVLFGFFKSWSHFFASLL